MPGLAIDTKVLFISFGGSYFSQGGKPVQNGRVGVMKEYMERVRGEIGEVVFTEFFQSRCEGIWCTGGVSGIGISLIFVMA